MACLVTRCRGTSSTGYPPLSKVVTAVLLVMLLVVSIASTSYSIYYLTLRGFSCSQHSEIARVMDAGTNKLDGPGVKESEAAKEVWRTCERLKLNPGAIPRKKDLQMLLYHTLYDDTRKLTFCYSAKVGCTNWKRVFAVLKSGNESHIKMPHEQLHTRVNGFVRYLSDLPYEDAIVRLAQYRRVMFVRNPVTRLLGVYRDHAAPRPWNASTMFLMNLFLTNRMPKLVGRRLKKNDVNITLRSFLNLVLKVKNPHEMDEHWQPYVANCLPCSMRYDYVGKHEDLPQSADSILQDLGIYHIKFPRTAVDYKDKPVREDLATKMLMRVPSSMLQDVWTQYRTDMELFGYSAPTDLGTNGRTTTPEPDTLAEFLKTVEGP